MAARLVRLPIYRSFQQAFEVTTGLPLVLRRPGTFQFPLPGSRRQNRFYLLAARCSRWCAACMEFEEALEKAARRELCTRENLGGLQETAIPVTVGDEVVAHLRTGGVFTQPPGPMVFAETLDRLGVPADAATETLDELEEALLNSPVLPPDHYGAAVRLLRVFAGQLTALATQLVMDSQNKEPPAITKARRFIAEHFPDPIHLADVARAASVSEFYFCKLFHRTTGSSFTRYLARVRVEAVKQALHDPERRMCDVAYAVGFQSLSQFNRVFHRVAGETPTEFRHNLHRTPNRH